MIGPTYGNDVTVCDVRIHGSRRSRNFVETAPRDLLEFGAGRHGPRRFRDVNISHGTTCLEREAEPRPQSVRLARDRMYRAPGKFLVRLPPRVRRSVRRNPRASRKWRSRGSHRSIREYQSMNPTTARPWPRPFHNYRRYRWEAGRHCVGCSDPDLLLQQTGGSSPRMS